MNNFLYRGIRKVFKIIPRQISYSILNSVFYSPFLDLMINLLQDRMTLCNFCGIIFPADGPAHSEGLICPFCSSIARDRVVCQCILQAVGQSTGKPQFIFNGIKALGNFHLLECSPRKSNNRENVYKQTLRQYTTSDFDMSAHKANVLLDLSNDVEVASLKDNFDIIICAHVLEHIQEYQKALWNLKSMLAPNGLLVLQVPILESEYTKVTWEEFHADNTRVYHRFGFDLHFELKKIFSFVQPVVGLLDFEITSPEINPGKYSKLKPIRDRCLVLGENKIRLFGLGLPDLCDAFILRK